MKLNKGDFNMAKELVAMLLAGGQGSRLYALTQKLAKPAVPFGGKYRIIDFPLSNCVNSGIDTVGILTQYQPFVLNEYIGNGQPWDLDRLYGGVHVLPPYQKASGSDWYKGTANAIYQNIAFIERYDPEYVIILSGDQICKQDYSDFLKFHKEKNAEFSVAVMEVPWEDASRFGLMVADDDDKITEFQEKPKNPKSNLASMGIYIFNRDILKKYLIEDENDPDSENDFGNNIIPNLLRDGRRMYAYHFNGYWKDVGTIPALWEANMEVLDPEHSGINLFDENWKIYSRNSGHTGHFIGNNAEVTDSMITDGCVVKGTVKHSILFGGVIVEEGAVVEDAVVMGDTVIKRGAKVTHCIVAEGVTVGCDAVIGEKPAEDVTGDVATIAPGVTIGDRAVIGPKAMVYNGPGTMLNMNNEEALAVIFANSYDALIPEMVSERLMASIPFAGRYRLCDFLISSMVHSGIDNISLIVKKNYHSLMDHLGSGQEFDLARKNGGINIVPPYAQKQIKVYEGRVEAIESLKGYLRKCTQKYVIMADANYVFNFDFRELIEAHKNTGADITAMYRKQEVPKVFLRPNGNNDEMYYTFDIDDGRIKKIYINAMDMGKVNFGMNIYIMEKEKLIRIVDDAFVHGYSYFTRDLMAANTDSLNIQAYEYTGYASQITDMKSYFEENMKLLDEDNREALFKTGNSIYTKIRDDNPTRYINGSKAKNVMVADGCVIEGTVENSILSRGVKIGKNAKVKNCILLQDTVIEDGANLEYVITDKNVRVSRNRSLTGNDSFQVYVAKGQTV